LGCQSALFDAVELADYGYVTPESQVGITQRPSPAAGSAGTLRDDAPGRTIARQTLVSGLKAGRAEKRTSKRKRRSKAIPALGAAGLPLTLASEASLASTAPALDTMTPERLRDFHRHRHLFKLPS
jgi:hypothetical protein